MLVSTVGASTGIVMNFLFTPTYGAIGSAIAWAASEAVVLVLGISMMKRYTNVKVNLSKIFVSLLKCIPYLIMDMLIFIILPESIEMWVALALNILLFALLNIIVYKNDVVSRHLTPIIENKFKTKIVR